MKPMVLPAIYLARHGETAWSLTGQHTGLTDLPLTERGEQNARRLGEQLVGFTFAKVFTSPLFESPTWHRMLILCAFAECLSHFAEETSKSSRPVHTFWPARHLTRNAALSVWLVLSVLFPIRDSPARHTLGVINRCSQSGLDFSGLTASLRPISWAHRILSHPRLWMTDTVIVSHVTKFARSV